VQTIRDLIEQDRISAERKVASMAPFLMSMEAPEKPKGESG
jgi:hypothetical protein